MNYRLLAILLCTLILGIEAVHAHDHDRARRALEAGEILPLGKVLAPLEQSHPGHVLEVELEHEHSIWVYEIKLLGNDGRVYKLEIDARDGSLLRSRSKEERRDER